MFAWSQHPQQFRYFFGVRQHAGGTVICEMAATTSAASSFTAQASALAWARPVLVAFVMHGFRGRIVQNYIFTLWRSIVANKKWSGIATDLRAMDAEGVLPPQAESKEKAPAAVFCVEELGVIPPPEKGWVPRGGGNSDGSSSVAGWWANSQSAEWIYHQADQMYFHLPTNTLWERRFQECCDPGDVPHTYIRVDAFHLKALSSFATSLDTALIPMAWKAWVRYTRRRAEKVPSGTAKDRKTEKDEAMDGEDKGHKPKGLQAAASTVATTATGGGGDSRSISAPLSVGGNRDGDLNFGKDQPAVDNFPSHHSLKETAHQNSIASMSAITSSKAEDAIAAAKAAAAAAAAAAVAAAAAAQAAEAATISQEGPSSSDGASSGHGHKKKKRRRWCCFSCFRGRRGKKELRDESRSLKGSADQPGVSTTVAGKLGHSTAKDADTAVEAVDSVNWAPFMEKEQKEPPAPANVKKPGFDTVDRHKRRLELFLAEVKKNPQKLINHVEKRRAGSSHVAYIVQ